MADFPIPAQSAAVWRELAGDNAKLGSQARNPGLIFDRFAPRWNGDGDSDAKKIGLKQVAQAAAHADLELLRAWHTRWMRHAEASGARRFSLETDWRLITGLGRKGPLEVGFTFHRYGFPIIPGSALKGLARAHAFLNGFGPDQIGAVFGRLPELDEAFPGGASGQAVFYDAIPDPEALPALELDVMNPHYPRYYQDSAHRTAPTNWQNPIPVYFLTVAPGTRFHFAVGWRGQAAESLHEQAKEWLIAGLTELGAGAKTSAGYGFFLTEEQAAIRARHRPAQARKTPSVPHYAAPPTKSQAESRPAQPRMPKTPSSLKAGDVIRGTVDLVEKTGVWLKLPKWPDLIAVIYSDQLGGKQYQAGAPARLEVVELRQEGENVVVVCKPAKPAAG